jgi:trigger factor
MKVTVEAVGACRRAMSIEVPPERVAAKAEEILRAFGQTAKVPGFRPGKVPRAILEQRYKAGVRGELLRDLVPEAFLEAIRQEPVTPVGEPDFDDVSLEEGQPLRFRATFEVKPEVEVRGYQGLELSRQPVAVSDEEVERGLAALQERAAEYVPMDGWPALRDDLVTVEYQAFVGGRPRPEGREEVNLLLGAPPFLPGFDEQVAGLQKGDAKEFSLEVGRASPRKEWTNRRVTFRVLVREVKKKRVPPLDDELARATGEADTLRELREKVRQNLTQRKVQEQEVALKQQLLGQLIAAHPFEVPRAMVEAEAEALARDFAHAVAHHGARVEGLSDGESLRARFRAAGERRARGALILEAVARQEGLSVSEEELEAELRELAGATNQDPAALRRVLHERGRLASIRARLLERKTLDHLFARARVTDAVNLVTLA